MTMRDEMEARMWVENHEQFSRDLEALFAKIAIVFRTLVEIEFEAPWCVVARKSRRCR
jgi:hypothetical protein